MALPILTRAGTVLGALSVTSTTERTGLDSLERLVPTIRPTVERIAEDAENWRFPDRRGDNQPMRA